MLSQGAGLIILTFLAKIAGFLRDLVLSYYYGASNIVDAYVVATTIPMVVFSFVGTGIETSLIPMLGKIEKDKKNVDYFISNLINVFLLICLIAIIVVNLIPTVVVKVFASGFDGSTLSIGVSFTRISIFGICFSTLIYIYSSLLHYKNKFMAAAFSTVLMDIVVLLFVYFSSVYGYWLLPIGNVCAFALQALFLRFFVKHRHSLRIDFKDSYLREMVLIIIPVIIGVSVNQLNLLIDQTLASRITVGGIAYLNYSNKVLGVVQGVFILSFVSLLFPRLSAMIRDDRIDALLNRIKEWSIVLEFFLIPCTIVFAMYSQDIIRILFERGQFNSSDTFFTGMILLIYAIELPFYGLRELISRVYYGYKDTKTPMINAFVGLVINVAFSVLLSIKYGLIGLAIGTTVSCICTCVLIVYLFLKRQFEGFFKDFISTLAKWTIFFCFVSFALTLAFHKVLPGSGNTFILKILLSFSVYFVVAGVPVLKFGSVDIKSIFKRG